MRIRRMTAVAGLAIALLGAAACSDDDETSSDGSATTAGADTGGTATTEAGGGGEPATGEPLLVASISHESGAGNLQPVTHGFAAFVAMINENGGVDGRPLEQVICDTAGDIQQATNCAREALDNPDILVASGAESRNSGDVMATFAAAEDPMAFICPSPVQGSENGGEVGFCLHAGSSIAFFTAMSYFADELDADNGFFITSDSPTGQASAQLFAQQADSLGIELESAFFSQQTADFLPIAQTALSSDPDFVIFGAGPEQELQIARAFVTLGSEIPLGTYGVLLPESSREQLADAPFDIVHDAPLPSLEDSDDPEVALYLQYMESEGYEDEIGDFSFMGWLSGRVVQQAIEGVGAENATRASILEFLRTNEITVPLLEPLSLANAPTTTPGQSAIANPTARVAILRGGETEITDIVVTLP